MQTRVVLLKNNKRKTAFLNVLPDLSPNTMNGVCSVVTLIFFVRFLFCSRLSSVSEEFSPGKEQTKQIVSSNKTLPCSDVSGHKNKTATEGFSDMSVKRGSSAGICL